MLKRCNEMIGTSDNENQINDASIQFANDENEDTIYDDKNKDDIDEETNNIDDIDDIDFDDI